jgi:anti-sigma factor RsiW
MEDFQLEEKADPAFWNAVWMRVWETLVRVKKMRHGILEQQWIEYIEGTLHDRESARLRNHANTCAECARTLRELSVWREKLFEESARVRTAFETSPNDLDRLLAASLERIRGLEPASERRDPHWSFREAVMLLRLLVEPFCGSGTAGATVNLAVQRSTLQGLSADTPAAWSLFVRNLSETMSSVCGTAAGLLVNEVGACLEVG